MVWAWRYDLRPMIDPVLQSLRSEIEAADRDLLAAFVRRVHVAARIREHKAEQGYELFDPARERQLLNGWRKEINGTISEETVSELFETVLRLSKRESGSAV
jgi:chorismate mutase